MQARLHAIRHAAVEDRYACLVVPPGDRCDRQTPRRFFRWRERDRRPTSKNVFATEDRQATTHGASRSSTAARTGTWVLVAVGSSDLRAFPLAASSDLVIGRGP